MKYARFEFLGDRYPHALEAGFERILRRIDALWDDPGCEAYFSDLIIDTRGARRGFPREVLAEILMLRRARETEALRIAHEREHARHELAARCVGVDTRQLVGAVAGGDEALVTLLVQAGVDTDVADDDGTPVLVLALKRGFPLIAGRLIRAGASVDARDATGIAPLFLACSQNTEAFRAVACELVRRGALVNSRDPIGYTPLLLALSTGSSEVAELLIEHGAQVEVRTRSGDTPLMLARRMQNGRLAALLESSGAKE